MALGWYSAPVDLAVFQVVQVDLADRRLLVAQRVLGVLAPVVGGADDDAVGEGLLARAVKKLSMSLFCSR